MNANPAIIGTMSVASVLFFNAFLLLKELSESERLTQRHARQSSDWSFAALGSNDQIDPRQIYARQWVAPRERF
ncbi:hypothetical protein [Thiomonas sp. FB-Cd]|uniref:hypothetical protein n=1 Tax=Thiomonas sp. FB-Cd TaxID=1158292 RepID=UPI0004DFCA5C|nr:hypothetical protein [Thiomonas sp. FB-Cd]